VCAFPRAIGVITHLSLAESLRVVLWVLGRCGGHRYFVIFASKKFAFEEDLCLQKIDLNQHQNPFRILLFADLRHSWSSSAFPKLFMV
jgi:hypothetical protein